MSRRPPIQPILLAACCGLAAMAWAAEPDSASALGDTLDLPEKTTHTRYNDSVSREFRKYWAEYEKREGIDVLRRQVQAHNNVDDTWVPHLYLFDSNVVVYPFWVVFRKKDKRARR